MKRIFVCSGLMMSMLLSLVTKTVFAGDPVTMNITGNVVASPCIANGGNANLNVDLGSIQAIDLSAAGSSSSAVDFDLKFTDCPSGTNNVVVTFTGTSDPVAGTDYYKNTGTANNVAVKLIQASTGNAQGNGAEITQPIGSDRTATLSLRAQAYSSAGGATPGTINSVVTTTFTYQ